MNDNEQNHDLSSPTRRALLQAAGGLAVLGSTASVAAAGAAATALVDDDDVPLVGWTALDLSAAIKAKEVSCVEVMEAYLAQIAARNPAVNAIVSMADAQTLLEEARGRDAELAAGTYRGWLHGIPHAVKDLADAAGLRTTNGSPIFADNIAERDSVHVARIKEAGAIIIGKTNVPEFGFGSQSYNTVLGPTGNAYDPTKTSGGSSGGAAVGLALQMLPVADGSDFMGSLRNPAAFNNVIGMRPTPGVVPLGNGFREELACNGPMGRNVSDTAMLLSTIAGYEPTSPNSLPIDPVTFAGALERDWKGTRVGWLGDFDGYLPMETGVLSLCEGALKGFAPMDCIVEPTTVDYAMPELWQTWLTYRHFRSHSGFVDMYNDPKLRAQLKPEIVWEIEGGMNLKTADIVRAGAARVAWYRALLGLFETYDYLVLPTAQVFPFDVATHWPKQIGEHTMDTYHRWMEVVVPGTLSGCPVINVPAGFNSQGLPMGMQIIGKRYADFALLQFAYAYEQATRWNLRVHA